MKHILTLFTVFTVLFSASAQETEGYLQYSIDVKAVDTTMKAKQQAGLLRNSKMEIFFTQNFSRVDFEMGRLYKLSAVVDLSTNTTLSLMSGAIGKFATRTLTVDTANVQPQPESSVELVDEEKVILGYNCKKAIVTVNGMKSVYWYTEEVDIDISGQQISNSLIPGFPLEFFTVAEGVEMHFTASNIEFTLEDKENIFYTKVPEGYVIMQDLGQN
ncbi:MAG: hypothetical protein HWE22_07050 [Flavobacteriales bacterium]|nr:hypothetical protein [Flavobacteriales bacterium]